MSTNKLLSQHKQSVKFSFTIDFQFEVLRYFIQSKDSLMVIGKVKPGYFTLIEHFLIMGGLHRFWRSKKRIPSEAVLVENINHFLQNKEYVDLVTKDDIPNVMKLIHNLYTIPLRDEDVLQENIWKFIAYIEMKNLNEQMDFSDFSRYDEYQSKVFSIIQNTKPMRDDEPLFMVSGTTQRQLKRAIDPDVVPTPYWQLNNLSNGNGYSKGSIFVLLDRPKAKKTFALINTARGYLTMKKNVLYIDTENGKNQIMDRMIQSTLNKTKSEILSGDYDKMEKQHMRKYKRLGVEFIVERVPALVGDCNSIRNLITKIKNEKGITIDILMVDYAAKLASVSREVDDIKRINQVYIDLDNLANEMGLEAIWTAQHITRDGADHKETRYEDNDIASSISIIRNAQCILGLNSTAEEEAHNIQRLEVVVQRDGKPHGRCLFNIDPDRQRWKEFSRDARKAYDETQGQVVDQMIDKANNKKKRGINPKADKEKANHKTGDI